MSRLDVRVADVVVFFFFQAEDGIRASVASRGLGDVYKGQALTLSDIAPSYKKAYVDWIESAKKEETRQRRITKSFEKLSKGEKLK